MSNSVVTAAAAVHAKKLAKNEKLAKQQAGQKHAADEQVPADKDQDNVQVVSTKDGHHVATSMSDVSLAGDFTFGDALADAASGSASLVSAEAAEVAQSDGSYGEDDGDGISGTLLLVGAIALVGLGVAVLAGGGNSNEPPAFAAATQAVTVAEDGTVNITATATDPDGDALVYTTSTPANGTLTGSNGAYTFKPNANFNGSSSFTVTATDPNGLTSTQTVNVTVTAVNDVPTAAVATQSLTTNEDTTVTATFAVTDVDNDTLTYTVSTAAGHGTATIGANGAISYAPAANFNGTDTFVVTANDGKGGTVSQTINVTIAAVADAPVADSDNTSALTVAEDGTGTVVIAYTDPDGDNVTATVVTGPAHGTLTPNADGSYTYKPAANYNGSDSIVYTVSDGTSTTTVTVPITVTAVNDAPTFTAGATATQIVDEDTASTVTLAATDVDGDTLTYTVGTNAAHGTVEVAAGGVVKYTPNADYLGTDTYTLNVADGNGGTDSITVNVDVRTTNVAPSFGDDSIEIAVTEDESVTADLDATDSNNDTLTYTVTNAADHGVVVINSDGTFTYTPNDGFNGDDSFVITVSDGRGGSDTLNVDVTVDPAELLVSIDRGIPSDPAIVVPGTGDADPFSGAVTFTDDATKNTNVRIEGFGEGNDDIIAVTGAGENDYSFSTGESAGGDSNDLSIVYTNTTTGAVNLILLVDVLNGGFVGNYETAAASVGYDFMTFG